MKVLFCGNNFPAGYQYTLEAVEKKLHGQVEVCRCAAEDVWVAIRDAEVVIPFMTKITADLITHASKLKMIMQFGVGVEGVDQVAATSRGVYVCNIPSTGTGNAESCAEHSILLAMACMRKITTLFDIVNSGKGLLGQPTGRTLYQSKVMVFGFGGIGKALFKRLLAFDVREITIVSNYEDEYKTMLEKYAPFVDDIIVNFVSTAAVLQGRYEVDVVFVCCNQHAGNLGVINEAFLNTLKDRVIIVNVARGGLLNYEDLWRRLEDGRVDAVGIDVFHTEPFPSQDRFLSHPKVIATPHVAGVTEVSYRNMAEVVAANVSLVCAGQRPQGVVNTL